jgi:hypothetical protein
MDINTKMKGKFIVDGKTYFLKELNNDEYLTLLSYIDSAKSSFAENKSFDAFNFYLESIILTTINIDMNELKNWNINSTFDVIDLIFKIYFKANIKEIKSNNYKRKIVIQ